MKENLGFVVVQKADSLADFDQGKLLFKEYAASLDFDLGYQNFEKELQDISLQYQEPTGALLLCFMNHGFAVGCVGIRQFAEGIAELKRLYVQPGFRGLKLGGKLMASAIQVAAKLGYKFLRLDTVPGQEQAQALYRHLGFYEIKPYRFSPLEGTIFFEKKLR